MPDPGLFDLVLKAFTSVFHLSWTGLTPQALWLVSQMAVWCLIPALVLAMSGLHSALPAMFQPLVKIALIVWAIANLESLTNRFADWVIVIGLSIGSKMMPLVGAPPMTLADFMSPGTVLFKGFDMMLPVITYVDNLGWYNAGAILMYDFFIVIPLWCCFVVVASHIIIAIVEFKMVALWSLFPLCFALFSGTVFVAAGALSGIIASAMRLGALAFVTGIILPLTFYLTIPLDGKDPRYWNIMAAGATGVLLTFMSIAAPRYASSFFGGAPAFTGATLIGAAGFAASGAVRGVQRWLRS